MAKPRSGHASMDIKHRSKQAYTYIKEINQTLWYRPRCTDVGLDHKIQIYTLPKGPKHKKELQNKTKDFTSTWHKNQHVDLDTSTWNAA